MQKKYFTLPYIICYLCALALAMKQLREPDMWWQLLSGKWMLENGAITRTDVFSYTMAGQKWINVKWLYEILIAGGEKLFGPHVVMLLQALVNIAIVYLLLRILYLLAKHIGAQVSTLYSSIGILLLLAVSEFRMAGRPEMISHLMTALYMFILWRGEGASWKQLWHLIILQCLWANMHEGYPVGLVIIGTYMAGAFIAYIANKDKVYLQQAIRLAGILLAATVAILINPNTIQLWLQPFEIYRQLGANKYTSELFSFTEPRYWTIQAYTHIIMLLAVVFFWVFKIVNRAKTGLKIPPLLAGYILSLPLLGYLSLSANRNIPFAQIAIFPTIPIMLQWVIENLKLNNKQYYKNLAKKTAIISAVIGGIFYITIVSNTFYKATDSKNRYGLHISMLHNPSGVVDFIRANGIKGVAFSDYFVSSYLLWELYPDFKSYIDLRDLDVFPASFFDKYFDMYHQPSKFYEEDSTYHFDYAVISTSQLVPLQQTLYWKEGYNVIYVDPVATIFLKEEPQNFELNHNKDIQRLFTWPVAPPDPAWAELLTGLLNPTNTYEEEDEIYAPLKAGQYYNSMQNYPITLRMLGPAVNGNLSENAPALTTMAYAYMEMSNYARNDVERNAKLDSASYYFNKSEEIDDKYGSTHLGLAGLNFMRGDYNASYDHLQRCKKLERTNDYVFYLDGICSRKLWEISHEEKYIDQTIQSMKRSIELNDMNDKAYLYLAEAYWNKGDKDNARKEMRHTFKKDTPWAKMEKELLAKMRELTGVKEYNSSMDLIKS